MKKITASDVRLMLAVGVCVVFFVATPTSPASSDSCYEHKDHGSINVDNPNVYSIEIKIHNKGTYACPYLQSRAIIDVKPGEYAWSAVGEFYLPDKNQYGKNFFYGRTIVKKDKVSYISIPKRDPS